MAEAEEQKDDNEEKGPSPAEAGAETTGAEKPVEGVKRTQRFRLALLAKLPKLGYTSWTVKDNFNIDEQWSTVVNLRADALLGPLETVAPERLV